MRGCISHPCLTGSTKAGAVDVPQIGPEHNPKGGTQPVGEFPAASAQGVIEITPRWKIIESLR